MTGGGPMRRGALDAEIMSQARARGVSPEIVRWQMETTARTGLRRFRTHAVGLGDSIRVAYATGATVEDIAAESGLDPAVVEAWIAGRSPSPSGTIDPVKVFCAHHQTIHDLPDVDAERLVYAYAAALTQAAAEVDRVYPAVLTTAATMPACPVEVLVLVDDGAEFAEAVRERVAARERAETSA